MTVREGSLEAPTRHPLDWRSPAFYDELKLDKELERVYEICHGCRRCVNLCGAETGRGGCVQSGSSRARSGVSFS